MSSDCFAVGRRRGARTSTAASDQAIFAAAPHLTARDRRLVRAVGEHRVLTTGQLAALGFGSVITARHRLAMLVQIGALRRFRPHRETGSAPWHYRVWLNGTGTTEWLVARVPATYGIPGLPHPDGLGIWAEHGREATFLLEYDTGSEHLPQLTAKLTGYANLAKAMADLNHVSPLLLFCFPTPRREQTARRALAACYHVPALRLATTATDLQQTSPAGPVWLPLRSAHAAGQVALCALDAALPDPWQKYRAAQERARQQATQPREPPGWDEDDGTWRGRAPWHPGSR